MASTPPGDDDWYDFYPEPNGETREEFSAKYPQFDDDTLDTIFGQTS